MDDALLEVVIERLHSVPLGAQAERFLLAACESESALAAELEGQGREGAGHGGRGPGAVPAGAYLRSITISGFRGIGPEARLDLEPGPGLTLVVGRNGGGKSSFAEGLEVLLTGDLRRWIDHVAWRGGWRNLHAQDQVRLAADLVIEDAGQAVAERTWEAGADFGDSRAAVQVSGEQRAGLERLNWAGALVTYRPFLSHSELEAFFSSPSQLYELLFSVLGLDALAVTDKRLVAARKELEDGGRKVDQELPALLIRLDSVDDERARSCQAALEGRKRDLAGAFLLVTGSAGAQPDGEVSKLRQLGQIGVPSVDQADGVVAALVEAADALTASEGSSADRAMTLARLLTSALKHYDVHGPGPCPVCGNAGALNQEWRVQTDLEVARLEGQAAEAVRVRALASAARAEAVDLFKEVPASLRGQPVGAADPIPARDAWTAWLKHPDGEGPAGLRALAEHITQAWPVLWATVSALAGTADAELRDREDRWAPVAKEVAGWCARAQEAEAAAKALPALKDAIRWLKSANDDIRNDRLAPLGEQARSIWSKLRQESNVDLGAIRLTGSNTQRKLDVQVTVDGTPGSALGVMSQGEINALALSIFIPRATIAASPFRFLVIDDPVQAMDPAKVEGLARVLADVAATRQVVVFTHDDRLPEAMRRLSIPGRVVEVTRRPGSRVSTRPALNPVDQQLKDASDLCADPELPAEVAEKVIPVFCRLAVEAAFIEVTRRTQLRSGRRHADIEADVEAADKLSKKAAMAMFGDISRGADVLPRLNSWRPAAANTYRALNKGAHQGHSGPLRALVADTRALTDLIREKLH